MNKFNLSSFRSTKNWYIRLAQWPVVILFYALMIIVLPIMVAIVALTWPFYDWSSEDEKDVKDD